MTIEEALSILELKPHFTTAELGKAYRHALMVWHPDRFSGNEELIKKAQNRTRGIIEAFDLLSPLAAIDDDASAATKQAENHTPAHEAGAKEKPRAASTVPLPQVERLTTTGKNGRGSSDRATWIITGVSVVVAGIIITVLALHKPKRDVEQSGAQPAMKVMAIDAESVSKAQKFGINEINNETIESYRTRAENGEEDAQMRLVKAYLLGVGAKKDTKEALKWLIKAAEQGHAKGQYFLGLTFFSGEC